jgi:hypothetical protein
MRRAATTRPRNAIHRIPRLLDRAPALVAGCDARIAETTTFAVEHLADQPQTRDRIWTD